MNSINSLLTAISSSILIAAPNEPRGTTAAPQGRRDGAEGSSAVRGGDGDSVEISRQAQQMADSEPGATGELGARRKPNGEPLSEEEAAQVDELEKRDREVRQHEQAHLAAAGPYARGGASYTYQSGPDGKRYAVGGEVQIDTAPVPNDPQATISKMQVVRRAALAPAEPSGQDRKVAAEASQKEQQARAELTAKRREEASGEGGDVGNEGGEIGTRVVDERAGRGADEGAERGSDGYAALLREAAVGAYGRGSDEVERAFDLVA